jgi:outer membrane cobalamin receptor
MSCRFALCTVLLVCTTIAVAQTTATLNGVVTDPSGAAIPEARVSVHNDATGFSKTVTTASDGSFSVTNIPYHSYHVAIEFPGMERHEQIFSLRSNIPVHINVQLRLGGVAESVTVSASDRAMLIDPEETGTHVQMNQSDIDKMALQAGNRGLESVIVTFPGFAQNANGAIHPRGAHNQMTFVIDGMPISDQLTGAFANAVDPNIVQTVELFTGNIPAEYGSKVSAVANVTTRSGLGLGRPFGGSVMGSGAEFDTLGQVTQLYGESGKFGYTASVNTMKTNRYLDQVSLDNLHNGGNSQRGFLRLDYQATDHDTLRLNLMSGRSSFELANQRSQHANGMDQRQMLRDFSSSVAWTRVLSPSSTLDAVTSYRTTIAQLLPSPGDTPVTAAQARHLSTVTTNINGNVVHGRHRVRGGFGLQYFPMSENFSLGVTDPDFNDPQSPAFISTLLAHDLSRGGTWFHFSEKSSGALYSGYVQDNISLGRFQLALGLRYDNYRFLVNAGQLQPRVGLSYHLKETGTVFRMSFNRLFQTPPNENLLLSNSPKAAVLVPPDIRETLGDAFVLIQPERQNFYEVGVQQAVGNKLSLNASYYHKHARHQQDNNNFFDTGIIFPITLARIRVNAVEGRAVVTPIRGFSGTVSVTHSRAISTPPFTGGLFLGQESIEALSQGPFLIDHDQALSVHKMLTYTSRSGFYSTLSTRYDSGLVANPSDPNEVAQDPDFFDLLPYVNLEGTPARVKPRTIIDAVWGYEKRREGRRLWDASVQITNLTNRTALYNFQSVFVGTRLVQPRTFGLRLRWYF